MTATCREACCSVTPQRTVSELFERGFRRNRAQPMAVAGPVCTGAGGNSAKFTIDVSGGRLAGIGFCASSCATLIAYCELIAEMMPNARIEIAGALTAGELVTALPGVPPLKQNRAVLAIAAFRAALAAAHIDNPRGS